MSSSRRGGQSSGYSGRSRQSARIVAQTTVDAKLDAEFEELRESFDYSQSVFASPPDERCSEKVTAYLQHIQKAKLIQPFGCLLALDDTSFKVIAFSDNALDMLTMVGHAVPSVGDHASLAIGTDIRSLFTAPSTAALHKALAFPEVSLLNPILVHCKTSGKPYYAILHRVTGALVVDFEPVKPNEVPITAAGALQSYKLAAKAITKLQSLPAGSMQRLCNTIAEEVFELTGYDRVMLYRFHDDDHGEVYAEMTKPGLEPYLGLHYPATDIPQAARFLFMKNKVRMICDALAKPVRVRQDEKLPADITFCGSTLRAPHTCHLQYMENMNSIASLVMAVLVNEPDQEDHDDDDDDAPAQPQQQKRKRLWGLVVCHHESPRFVPFPLRYACEFLMQVFAIHVNKEIELECQIREKNILRTQTLLCDLLLRETSPLGIVNQSPNVMDLVKCDGAAFLYQGKVWRLGVAPTGSQVMDIAYWLSEHHMDSTGLSTDSLHDAGYPGALDIGDTACGMAAAWITSKDILFWFRLHTAAEVRWGGAKHDPAQRDDDRRMHPRSSFKAFLEVVKLKSLPWNDYEMDAIHSLQLILRGTLDEDNLASKKKETLESKINDLKLEGMMELQAVTNEMVRLIETATVPIFAVDADGLINGWNLKIAQLTGLSVDQAIGKHMLDLVEDCSMEAVENMLKLALQGKEESNVQFQMKTHGPREDDGPVILIVNACASRDINKNVAGVCFVAQDMTGHKMVMDKFTRIEGDYKAIVQNPSPLIPPIFGADEFGWCSEWNAAMTKLSGWQREDVIDKMLLGEVFGAQASCCHMKTQDNFVKLSVIINNALTGQETEKSPFSFINRRGKLVECLLSVSKKDDEGGVTGVFCFLQIASHELQHVIRVQQLSEQTAKKKLKASAYMRHEIKNPLSGIMYCRKVLEGTDLTGEQRGLLNTGKKCHSQLNRILDDLDLSSIMDSCLEMDMVEFTLQELLVTAISQVVITSQAKEVRLLYDSSAAFMSEGVYGDSLRLQQILAGFLLVSVKFASNGGLVKITATLNKDRVGRNLQVVHAELRIEHSGGGVPEFLLSEMFGCSEEPSDEGLGLLVSRKLLGLMNGDARYLREAGKGAFIITVELASASRAEEGMRTFL